MKVDLLVEIGKNVTLATNLIFTNLRNYDINIYKYPSRSIHMILNYKPVYT